MDVRKLENLEAFAKFFDFVSNPDEYRATIDEAKKVIAEFNEMTLKARGIRELDVYRAEVLASLNQKEKELASKVADAEANIRFRQERQSDNEAKVSQRQNDVALRMQEVVRLRGELEDVAAKRAEMAREAEELADEKKRLVVEKASFAEKLEAFNKLRG
jgi:chromosome segregation ATPase